MSLTTYRKKRTFSKTPEPKGENVVTSGPLRFVVQKHEATRLHYDFRLELDGVLKSWAVPRGPSLNPEDKHLAVMVEDHPMEYASFEGIIPKGNYGAGTVMVWDEGIYTPYDATDREEAETILRKQLKDGHLTFVLLGNKLKGEFALVHTRKDENTWLLIKKGDEYASTEDISKKDNSVASGRSMSQIAKQAVKRNEVWQSKRTDIDLSSLPISAMPKVIKPMLAQTADEPFNRPQWIFEMKWDGYRTLAFIEKNNVTLKSRNNISYDEKFQPIIEALKTFPTSAVFDGEVVALDSKGHPRFQWLQDYPKSSKGELVYYIFDVLYYDGRDTKELPLIERKELLEKILPVHPQIRYSEHIEEEGIAFFNAATRHGLEGIVAKNSESTYRAGDRSYDWMKMKTHLRQEAIICGFTKPNGGRKYIGSLVLGMYQDKKLVYVGHSGGGFKDQDLKSLHTQLSSLRQDHSPFKEAVQTNAPVTWVNPKIVCGVSFTEWTENNQMRHPKFLGLREDKKPSEVQKETEFARKEFAPSKSEEEQASHHSNTKPNDEVKLSNLDKIFWPEEKYTKGDLVEYYKEVAPIILPYLKDRPESLLRYPNGITGESFYQKNVKGLVPGWINTVPIESDSEKKTIEYMLCQDVDSLLYMINLGCIDLNPWSSRIGNLENPDYLLIDLDPHKTTFEKVITTAQVVREVLESLEIASFPKTSGAKGIHIYIPTGAKYSYEQVKHFTELICVHVHQKIPEITSLTRSPDKREGKVYLDYLQNRHGQTLASAYSVRAMPGATVSTPLQWSEVTTKLHPSKFTIKNTLKRLEKHGDLFNGILGKGISIEASLKKFDKLS